MILTYAHVSSDDLVKCGDRFVSLVICLLSAYKVYWLRLLYNFISRVAVSKFCVYSPFFFSKWHLCSSGGFVCLLRNNLHSQSQISINLLINCD